MRRWLIVALGIEVVIMVTLSILAGTGVLDYRDNSRLILIAGLGVFFVIEKLVLWWHAHAHVDGTGAAACPQHANGAGAPVDEPEHRHSAAHAHDRARDHASGMLVLVGDSLHNALDGAPNTGE